MKPLYIVDVSGSIYRSYFAIKGMTNSRGESTNGLFGFIRSYQKFLKDFSPEYVVAVFDGPNNGAKREAIYPEYKANRKEKYEDLYPQIEWAKTFCDLSQIPFLDVSGVEADDVMASIAMWAKGKFSPIYLLTGDKDMCQIVDKEIFLLNTHKENLIVDEKGVEEIYGVPPDKIVDLLAIMGDSSDNVPGIEGFGVKTAASLLNEFGSLDYILEHPEKVKGEKKQALIREQKEKALLSRRLVVLDKSVSVPQDVSFYHLKEAKPELISFYKEMNFSSLLKEMKPLVKEERTSLIVDTLDALKEMIQELRSESEICIDTETTSLNPLEAKLVGIGLGGKKVYYIPFNGSLHPDEIRKLLQPLFEEKKFFGHNIKYDLEVLKTNGFELKNIVFDTIIASYVLSPEERNHSLDQLSLNLLGKVKIPTEELIGKGKTQITMDLVPIEKVANYCCEDVECTIKLKELFKKELTSRHLDFVFNEIDLPLIPVLAGMERRGIYLDKEVLKQSSEPILKEIGQKERAIYELAGTPFNINSPKQVGEILFDHLKIPCLKKNRSTAQEVLVKLEKKHPIISQILEYRVLEKLRSTYIDTLPEEINPKTHRIHCNFSQITTATGRLACQNPNLQNIPVKTEVGRTIRAAFRPEKRGWSYISCDYSQIELRLLAHLSGDKILIEAFQNNQDIHRHTASQVLNIPLDQVTDDDRRIAKAVNFGLMYGQQAFGLSQGLMIDLGEAARFIDAYFKRYSGVKEYIEESKNRARKELKAVTLFGRERPLPEIVSSNPVIRAQAERFAINTPLQGSQADLIKLAMIEIDKRIKSFSGFMILQIHDELIFEVPDNEVEPFGLVVKKGMESVISLKVPLIVDMKVGKNWKEC